MSGKIYLIQDDETLQALSEQPYASEDRLQALLAKYPDLLAGDQMNEAAPRRWLLVSREYGVPDAEGGTNRWSLDHLFLDQDGIPTLVEVKRSTDTRTRREVVAQMLDYAANGVIYWPVEEIRAKLIASFKSEDDAVHRIAELVGASSQDEEMITDFWSKVKINLQAGRIRMIFLADAIPNELRRIIEFLNEQMDPAEVLAIEVKQYVGEGLRTLVPTIVGQTAEAQKKKTTSAVRGTLWNEHTFFAELNARFGSASAEVARKIYDWVQQQGCIIDWRRGDHLGGFMVRYSSSDSRYTLFKVDINDTLMVFTSHYNGTVGGKSLFEPQWSELQKRMKPLQIIFPDESQQNKDLRITLTDIHNNNLYEQFEDTFRCNTIQIRENEVIRFGVSSRCLHVELASETTS